MPPELVMTSGSRLLAPTTVGADDHCGASALWSATVRSRLATESASVDGREAHGELLVVDRGADLGDEAAHVGAGLRC